LPVQQPIAPNMQQPITLGDVPGLDIESVHDEWLCSLPGTELQPSFRDAC